jgi:AcrR family transcriptional regulator
MAVRLTRNERRAKTREDILAAARSVFLGRGFHGATLDEIALEAGYTKGAVYSNFASKDDLFLALLDERFEWRIADSLEAARTAPDLDAALRANARLYAEAATREPAWDPLLVEFWTHASRDPALRAAAAERHERVLAAVAELLLELAQRFDFEWSVPPREVARAGGALARGMTLERLLDPAAFPLDGFEERFGEFVRTHVRGDTSKGDRVP